MNASLELMPFQVEGANLLAASARAMLVWDPGVGKTPTAVRAAVKTGAARILVLCPPIAVSVWRQHFLDWSNIPDVRVLDAFSAAQPFMTLLGKGVRIVPYSRVGAVSILEALLRHPFDVVIIDEAHYLKNSDAQRTRAVYGRKIDLKGSPLEAAAHIWCLTGTPVLNHAQEFWTHLHALRPDLIHHSQFNGPMPLGMFTDHYCVVRSTPYGSKIIGSKNTHELAGRIRPLVNRRRMSEVLKDMPPLRIVTHPLAADTELAAGLRRDLAEALASQDLDEAQLEAMEDDELLATLQAGGVAFSTVRRLIGRAKVKPVAQMVSDMLDDAEEAKLIVFAHHREVIRDLAEALKAYKPLVIKGDTPHTQRDSMIAQFQHGPAHRLIILAIDTAGEVITLNAAHNVVLMEPSPVPTKNHQAIARAHRRGQRSAVVARFVLLPGTLDARLMALIARKTKDIAQIVDGVDKPVTV